MKLIPVFPNKHLKVFLRSGTQVLLLFKLQQ